MARRPTKKQMKRVAGMLAKNPELARAILTPLAEVQGYTGNEEAEAAFKSLLDAFGAHWLSELMLLSVVSMHLPRILVFVPNTEEGAKYPWRQEHAEAGCFWEQAVTRDMLRDRMREVLAAHAPEGGVALWVMASHVERRDELGSFGYLLHSNGAESAVLFRRERHERVSASDPWWAWIETVLSGVGEAARGDVLADAQKLRERLSEQRADSTASPVTARPLSDENLESPLTELAARNMNTLAENLTALLTVVSRGTEAMETQSEETLASVRAQLEAAHATELTRRQRQVQADRATADRITEGLRARITRLEGELKSLRKQVNAQPVKQRQRSREAASADSLGTALDRFFS